jgi:hypothetical protein
LHNSQSIEAIRLLELLFSQEINQHIEVEVNIIVTLEDQLDTRAMAVCPVKQSDTL